MFGEVKMGEVLAILCSDLHLSHDSPASRSVEDDWYAVMDRSLSELRRLSQQNGNCPVICAGDVFHRWNCVPQLINWAIESLPRPFYAVPGQHDLPYHRLEEVKRSAYYTLISAGVIRDLGLGPTRVDVGEIGTLWLYGRPWGSELGKEVVVKRLGEMSRGLHVMVVHRYFWEDGFGYVGASESAKVSKYKDVFGGFDVVVAGDNHVPFSVKLGKCTFWNCGCLIRRALPEAQYPVRVGLLMSDGEVREYRLWMDEKWDRVADGGECEGVSVGFDEFLEDLRKMEVEGVDFGDFVIRYLSDSQVREPVRRLILEVLEESR